MPIGDSTGMSGEQRNEGSGCAALFGVLIVLALIVAAVISIAALADPFSSLPPVGEIWEDCEQDYGTAGDECDLANRFPGFWGSVAASLAWVAAAAASLTWLAGTVSTLRHTRAERFSGPDAPARYGDARAVFATAATVVAAVAALPVILALA